MLNARYCYLKWGATRKVRDLDTRYPHLSRMSGGTRTEIINTKDSTSTSDEVPNLQTVTKASQAISSEIMLDKLLAKLMKNYSLTLEQKVAERTLELQAKNERLQQEICDRLSAQAALHTANQQQA